MPHLPVRRGAHVMALAMIVAATAAPARGQDDEAQRRYLERQRVEQLTHDAERFAEGRADQGEVALAIWAWRLEAGSLGRRCVEEAAPWLQGPARELLDALVEPPPLPRVDEVDDDLAALLVTPPDEDVLARALRSARFSRALDRLGVDAATAPLDPAHPWVVDAREREAREAPQLERVARMFALLDLPVDPRRAARIELFPPSRELLRRLDDDKARGGWVLSHDAHELLVLDDRLRTRRLPIRAEPPALGRADVESELRQWAVPPRWLARSSNDPLDVRGSGATALRAWWAMARGKRWTATRIVEAFRRADDEPDDALVRAAEDLARASYEAALVDLSTGAPRSAVVDVLKRAAALLEAFPPAGAERSAMYPDLLEEVSDLGRRLAEQNAALRVAPRPPSWPAWQELSATERIPYLIRALPDCDGDPTDMLGFGGGGPQGATQRVPADAPVAAPDPDADDHLDPVWSDWTRRRPSRRSAFDGLIRCGVAAIPALIEALGDLSPTRSVASDRGGGEGEDLPLYALTVGDCADEVFRTILDDHDLWLSLQAGLPNDRDARHRERQARVAAWWASVAPRGGLVGHHLARLISVDRELSRLDGPTLAAAREHRAGPPGEAETALYLRARHARWLFALADRREVETVRALVLAAPHAEGRAQWLELLGEAPHDGYDALLAAELGTDDDRVALAAAWALVNRDDRRGLARALEVVERPSASDDAVSAAMFVLAAGQAEVARLAARLVVERPGCDATLCWVLDEAPASAERTLALTRIAARPLRWSHDVNAPPRRALELLEPVPPSGRPLLAESDRPRVVVRELAHALQARHDTELVEHAAVTAALLGESSIAALASAIETDLRPVLHGALTQADPARREAAVFAVSRLDVESLTWLAGGANDDAARVLEQLRRRAALRVLEVVVAHEVEPSVRSALEPWAGAPLDLDLVSDVLEAWEQGRRPALTIEVERRPGVGVTVRVTAPADAGEDRPGWLLEVEAEGPGQPRETGAAALAPSVRSTHALTPVQNALADHPDVAARIVIRARR